ncbi:GNAT family N-acetyltransferase [Actinokineospora sp. NBRC 105648]|uniref:GNAT family N-acetyltransferase n=1 Tax=Actinokineospora sp. NBRC 105648 TaxID=3032206 RepID=UPI0024A04624|nr:GNAT family N-acetyltransferase [Actinokineospora sp. NBRC 105648]GLZ38620.1 acetyltransferase [Actinokineospora sp. NBRC 105648]
MTAAPSPSVARFADLTGDELRARLREALSLYVTAMRYPKGTAEQRAPMWLAHMLRAGWRSVVALDADNRMLGVAYGYQGAPGQWWHEQVKRGVTEHRGHEVAETWMTDYFELTELHVLPDTQGQGIGNELVRRLVAGATNGKVLLSTPEGPSKAWSLYRRLEFQDVLRHYQFAGDPRPFGVLGRTLPL